MYTYAAMIIISKHLYCISLLPAVHLNSTIPLKLQESANDIVQWNLIWPYTS